LPRRTDHESNGQEDGLPARAFVSSSWRSAMVNKCKAKAKSDKTEIEHADKICKQLMAELGELGDRLAQRECYEQVSGMEAIWYYLIQKHHWTPKKVREMHLNDLHFCLKEERL
jgi:hypothetical protein